MSSEMTPTLPPERLIDMAAAILRACKVPDQAAQTVAEALVDADREGLASHGLMLLPMYVDRLRAGSISTAVRAEKVVDTGPSVVLDAHNMLGQLSARQAVDLLLERTPQHGLAAVAVRNGFHFGTAGRWASLLAEAGLIGVALSNTRPLMPAPGGAERLVGNNPIAIAMPAQPGEPLMLDMAMSATAMGRIRLADAAGQAIPTGWATDAQGNPTTDPAAAIKGMLLPAGGAKGFGLALMIDLLCGGLSAGAITDAVQPLYGNPATPYGCAHFFLAIDVARFRPLIDFEAATTALAERIRQSRPLPDQAPMHAPGDRSRAARARHAIECPLARETIAALNRVAGELSLNERLN